MWVDRDKPEDLSPHPTPSGTRTVTTRMVQFSRSPLDSMADVVLVFR